MIIPGESGNMSFLLKSRRNIDFSEIILFFELCLESEILRSPNERMSTESYSSLYNQDIDLLHSQLPELL